MRALNIDEVNARLKSDGRGFVCLTYSGMSNKAEFRCPKGHTWKPSANSVVNGKRGCPTCRSENIGQILSSITPQEVAKRLTADGRGITCIEFNGMSDRKSTFRCPEGHTWEALADSVVNRKIGCRTCYLRYRRHANEVAIDEVRSRLAADGRGISCLEYTKMHSKAKFSCANGHTFTAKATNILNAGQGCGICGREQSAKSRSTSKSEFERRLLQDGRSYTCLDYVKMGQNATFRCAEGHEWKAFPSAVLTSGNGCGVCSGTAPISFNEVNRRLDADRRGITCLEFRRTHKKATFRCKEGHVWETKATDVINKGSGCPDCAESGFNPSDRAELYYIAVTKDDGDTLYKIGITNFSVAERFRAPDLVRIRIIKTWQYAVGHVAAEREREIKSQYAGEKYVGPPILISDGNTELFTHDILGLDKD
jgi:hypothetical protein